jgi:hypothetical protein
MPDHKSIKDMASESYLAGICRKSRRLFRRFDTRQLI